MRKIPAALFAILLLFLALLPSCAEKNETRHRPSYRIEAELFPERNELSLKTEIRWFIPQDGLSAVKLRLYPNAYGEGDSPVTPEKTRAAYPSGENYGGAEILSVSSNAGVKDYSVGVEDDTVLTVRLNGKKKKGEEIRLVIEEIVRLASIKHRLGSYGGYYTLSGFYPAVCPFSGGKFRADPYEPYGDPFLFKTSDFSVDLTLPVGFDAAASAVYSEKTRFGKRTTFRFSLENARDFAVVCSNRFQTAQTEEGGVPIRYFYESDKKSAELLKTAANAVRLFRETFGEFPYPSLTIAAAPFCEAGMEFSGLALLSNELTSAAKKHTAVHEIAHQWWFGKVGFDQFLTPWMDEGLAEYATAFYYKASGLQSSFRAMIASAEEDFSIFSAIKGKDACRLDAPLPDLADGYCEIAYRKSLLFFSSLAEIEGYERMNGALKEFADRFEGKIASPSDLIDSLSRSMKKDLSPYYEKWRDGALPVP
ncbi:MAG: M1 family metallopeptidase [Clostridia bacterium]|nr:M1 family metallopeptidase [Clostridia bacterium]